MNPRHLFVRLWFAAFAAGAALAAPQQPAPAPAVQLPTDAPGLFKSLCATCHGESGDGNGTTKLDRPARSFKDGGFSYGNTPDAIAKTLAYGIPGSVMPSFGTTLDDAQRMLLARYVIELGPNDQPTESPDRVMVVKDRAVVARGKLPALVEKGEEIPRGLLVGTPDGFTFAYRTDDLRLIAVYQGEFAERTDWMGRGGSQLKPLGKLVVELGETPGAMFVVPGKFGADPATPQARSLPLQSRLTSSRSEQQRVVLTYDLLKPAESQAIVLRVEETISGATTAAGSGWRRHFRMVNPNGEPAAVQLMQPIDPARLGVTEAGGLRTDGFIVSGGRVAKSTSGSSGKALLRNWCCLTTRANSGNGDCVARVEPRQTIEFELLTVIAPNWNDEVEKAWHKEVLR